MLNVLRLVSDQIVAFGYNLRTMGIQVHVIFSFGNNMRVINKMLRPESTQFTVYNQIYVH